MAQRLATTHARGHEPRALPVAARAHRRRLLQSSGGCSISDVFGLHVTIASGLGCQQPDDAMVGKRADGINQCIDQVSIVIAPPQQDNVNDIVVVVVHELDSLGGQQAVAKASIGIVVGADLPDHVARLDREQAERRGAIGAHRVTPR